MNSKYETIGNYDVIVVGAGPAGLCAAMSAAREGMKVALIERHGIVGGNITSGHVRVLLGNVDSKTMAGEINTLLDGGKINQYVSDDNIKYVNWNEFDVEDAKIKLINWISHKNITLYLLTTLADTVMENSKICGVVVATQNGLKTISGNIIIDATGDGVVSHLAGAPSCMGRDSDGLVQPTSIMFTLYNIDEKQSLICHHEEDDTQLPNGSYLELCKKACKNNELPPNVNIIRLYETSHSKTERTVNATQTNHVNGLDPVELANAELDLRNQMLSITEFLRKNVWGFENCSIRDSADCVGVRETRRVMGEYVITAEDLFSGKSFEDTIVHNAHFAIDIHNPDGAGQSETDSVPHSPNLYNLPYRAFLPLKVDNLYTVGRCISGDHRAHASYRVMNIAMAGGEAIGIAASLCVKNNVTPKQLNYKEIQAILRSRGINI